MGWCGSYKSDLWQHGTLAPCKTGTIAASIFLAAAAIVGLAQYFRIQTVVARRPAPLSLPTAKQAVSSTAYGFIALLHAAWLTYLVLGPHAYFAPFELAYELTLLLIWSGALVSAFEVLCITHACQACNCFLMANTPLALQVLLYFAHRQQVTLRLLWLAWPALLLYSWMAYTASNMYINSWGLTQSQALARAILSFFQLVLLLAAALNDSCRCVKTSSVCKVASICSIMAASGVDRELASIGPYHIFLVMHSIFHPSSAQHYMSLFSFQQSKCSRGCDNQHFGQIVIKFPA